MPVHGFASAEDFERARQSILKSERDVTGQGGRQGRYPLPTPQGLVGKCDANVTQGDFGTVSIWSAVNPTDWGDLVDTNHNESALFLLGAGTSGDWVALIPCAFGYLAVNAECP